MTELPAVTVFISSDLPNDERESLRLVLHTVGDVQEPVNRAFDPDWITFIVKLVEAGGGLAGSVTALIKLINEIITWRCKARQRNVEPKVRLQRPNQPPLDLATATDEEVRTWLLRQNPR